MTKFSYKIITYFENLTVEQHVLYALNRHVEFRISDIVYYVIYNLIFYR